MKYEEILKTLEKHRIVPVIAIESAKDALPLADALIAGGLPLIEITFRTAAAAEALQIIARERPNLLLGAGTILTMEVLEKAKLCGAIFGVAPGLNPRVVKRATELEMMFVPGICTPTEIEAALEAGSKVLKFFPAGAFGGLKTLSALAAPYLQTGVKFMPTGGVNPENLKEYLGTKGVLAVGGTWLATKDDIAGGKWAAITEKCRKAVELRNQG
ncbi:MAG: bifunctional 4-hydroxy-2-oxoglutarate aldolase/2-dehydro-3-deoxy-phosphogluconate aldolase [Chitinivibrionales bacterium]|nr:bifunctional 4-hydroxy-2-oxoglutarate aldolase/2-dehydro-3-deoxy-phosphogluconate aldolase [Chitinivibrionales bacterium]